MLCLPPSLPTWFLFIFSLLCAPHHYRVCLLFSSYYPSSPISLPSCSLTVWISLVHMHASVFLPLSPSPSLLSWVISLSYVCPSLCVCVPPLFVSDSFSREIRDAYLVPLFSTSAAALSYTVQQWPRRKTPHPLIMTWSVSRARCRIKPKAAPVHWAKCEFQASTCITVSE